MDVLEAEARGRQDGHRHDPRPDLRRAALPPGGADQRPARRAGSGGSRPRPAAPVRDLRRARARPARRRPARSSSTTPTTTTRRDGERHYHDERPLMDPIAFFVDPMTYGFMQRGLVAALLVGIVCAVMGTFVVLKGLAFIGDAVSHAAFPGLVDRVHHRRAAVHRRGDRGRRDGPRDRPGVAPGAAPVRHVGRRPVRRDVRASGVMLFSTIKGYVTRPARLPARQRPRDRGRRTSSRSRSSGRSSWRSSSSSARRCCSRRSIRSARRPRGCRSRVSSTCSSPCSA